VFNDIQGMAGQARHDKDVLVSGYENPTFYEVD
jgi:hypothetical protein